ncbi:unnamed protein product, partial [Didymodactylos carnosus]
TPHWASPETIQGTTYGRKADIWSLGCSVVEMFTKNPPWHELSPIAAIFQIATCDKPKYTLPETASIFARQFLDLCFTKDYHQRPTADDLLKHPFILDQLSSVL